MNIKLSYIVAVNSKAEVVAIATDTRDGHVMKRVDQFDTGYNVPYYWGSVEHHQMMLNHAMNYYQTKYFSELERNSEYCARQRSNISDEEFHFEIRTATIEI